MLFAMGTCSEFGNASVTSRQLGLPGKAARSKWPFRWGHSWPPRAPQGGSEGVRLPYALRRRGLAPHVPPRGRGPSSSGCPSRAIDAAFDHPGEEVTVEDAIVHMDWASDICSWPGDASVHAVYWLDLLCHLLVRRHAASRPLPNPATAQPSPPATLCVACGRGFCSNEEQTHTSKGCRSRHGGSSLYS